MTPSARRALKIIRECLDDDQYRITVHFSIRMKQRGMVWADVVAIIDEPTDVRTGGSDEQGRPKWLIRGNTFDELEAELVCTLDEDARGHWTIFITIYWEKS